MLQENENLSSNWKLLCKKCWKDHGTPVSGCPPWEVWIRFGILNVEFGFQLHLHHSERPELFDSRDRRVNGASRTSRMQTLYP